MPRPSAADVVEPQPAPPPPLDLADASLYINRELGWLAFNQRVLDQANDPAHPLLERVKFLSIAASNLDEFYMVRVATLLKKLRAGMDDVSPDGLHTEQQLVAIRQRAAQMLDDIATCWQEQLRPQLEADGIRLLEPQDYTPEAQAFLSGYFKSHIWPVLTPLAFDPGIRSRTSRISVTASRSSFAIADGPSSRASRCPIACRASCRCPSGSAAR